MTAPCGGSEALMTSDTRRPDGQGPPAVAAGRDPGGDRASARPRSHCLFSGPVGRSLKFSASCPVDLSKPGFFSLLYLSTKDASNRTIDYSLDAVLTLTNER